MLCFRLSIDDSIKFLKNIKQGFTTNEDIYFLLPIFVGVNRLFIKVYSNQDVSSKRFKT